MSERESVTLFVTLMENTETGEQLVKLSLDALTVYLERVDAEAMAHSVLRLLETEPLKEVARA